MNKLMLHLNVLNLGLKIKVRGQKIIFSIFWMHYKITNTLNLSINQSNSYLALIFMVLL